MRGNSSSPPVTDEYNEDTDKANDSEDDQWEDNKLIIDLNPNSSMNTADNSKPSQSSDAMKPADDNSFTPPEPKVEKPKGKRGAHRKNDKLDAKETTTVSTKINSKQGKTEKDKPTPNKPGRKRKEKPAANSKATNGDVKSPASLGDSGSPSDPYKFETEEGVSATVTGKHSTKDNKTNAVVMKDAQTDHDWRSIGSVTEPEQLAPCEPGTQVCLEGIVWQETNNGVLIVNVTWRGKTYMGTLLDATKHDWSPPSCDSPVAELEGRTPKGRGKRSRGPVSDTFQDFNERKLRKEMRKQSGAHQPSSPAKSEPGKRRNRNSEGENEPTTKRGRTSSRNPSARSSNSPPALIECPEPNCGKKYKQMNGLKYHQRNAHQDTASHISDSLSETEKPESVPSPVENKRMKRKNKGESCKGEIKSEAVTPEPKPAVKAEPEESENKPVDSTTVMQTNTTSVITSTTTQISNSNQQSNVPVATITPQVVKPTSTGAPAEEQAKSTNNQQSLSSSSSVSASSTNRPLTSAPKLFPKSSGNSMAPISTITSQGVYNPSLKPIQPKPTILGESSPNPTLTDLRDHKKLKRKRSASRDDLTNGTSSPYPEQMKPVSHKPEPEVRSISQQIPTVLQSPSYSDISEEGEIRNARREMLSGNKTVINDPMCPPPATYPVATVSPQKNIPPGLDRERPKIPSHSNHSPAPKPVVEERTRRDMEQLEQLKQREFEMLKQQYGQFQPQMPWPQGIATGIPPQDLMQMQFAYANRERQQRRSVSPRPSSIKSSPAPQVKELEAKASSDRLQLLKENKDMKPHGSNIVQQEVLPDFQSMQNPHIRSTEDMNKFLMFQKMQQNQQKRESLQTHSPAHKPTSSKVPEPRPDHLRASRSSPMPPQPGGGFVSFMSNPLFQFSGIPGVGSPMPPSYLPPGFPYPAGLLDAKDPTRAGPPSSMFPKNDHKIHELESHRASKSPRPTADRPHSAKTHPSLPPHSVFSAYSAAAAAGLNGPAIPGLFQPK